MKSLLFIVLGIIFAHFFKVSPYFLLVFFFLALSLSFFTNGYSLFFALFVISAHNYEVWQNRYKNLTNFPIYDTPVKITARIIDTPISENKPYSIELMSINQKSVFGKAFLYYKSQEKEPFYGDIIELYAQISDFDFVKNPNLIDYNDYFHKQGFIGNIFQDNSNIKITKSKQGSWHWQYVIFAMRRYFLNTIGKYLAGDEKDLLLGILLGEKRALSKNLTVAFADSGIAHILAVSGLHISIIIGIGMLLLSIFRVRGVVKLMVLVLLTAVYLALIGFKASAVRAGLMTMFACLGLLLERRYEPINGVFLAGIIILLFTPRALFDISFQLSFVTTTAILLMAPRLYNSIKNINIPHALKTHLLLPLFVSFSAMIGVAPLLSYYFFEFPVPGVFANLLVIPLVSLAIPLGFLV
ncbi:MAG: ComEC/Rec2 family competence protein, partial [candidate division WOR-3 bacterium]|nr:ComEC/Rec2 family competence protein [candidate division WOR-3 bacterium]